MKFNELKAGKVYERESDGKLFKTVGTKFYCAEEGEIFKETEEISLSDVFKETHRVANDSLMEIYQTWKSGEIDEKQRAFDRLLLEMIKRLENE